MSWLDDTLSSITGGNSATLTVDDSSDVNVGASVNGDVTDVLASVVHSSAGDSLRAAADRLLGNNNPVDQVYGAVTAAANGGNSTIAKPAATVSATTTLIHYAPIIVAVVVALALLIHGKLR